MLIPYDQLQPQTLAALIEDFVTRNGAVHGHADTSLQQQRQQVMSQLRSGVAVIVFDEEDESVTIVTRDQLRQRQTPPEGPGYEDESLPE